MFLPCFISDTVDSAKNHSRTHALTHWVWNLAFNDPTQERWITYKDPIQVTGDARRNKNR